MRKTTVILLIMVLVAGIFGCSKPASTPPASAPEAKSTSAPKPAETPPAPAPAPAPAAPADTPTEVAKATPVETPPTVQAPSAEQAAPTEAPTAPVEGGKPKLVVPEPEFNFGKVDNSETVEHDFILRNEGTGVLKIESVRASCGCTTTELEKNELAPGEEIKIHAATNLKGRQGPQTKSITVMTNDPDNPSYQLRIVGEAIASIAIEPMSVQFGRIMDDEPREATVVIQSNKPEISFKVLSAELDGIDFVKHEIIEVEPGKKYDFKVRTEGKLPEGNHNGRFIIRTDSQERAVIWLPVSLQVIGPLQIMPPVINIRVSDNPEEVEQQQLSITAGRVAEFVINEVVVPLDTIQHELIQAAPNVYRLRLSNMPRTEELEGKSVILKTNLVDSPEVSIPFNIYKPRLKQIPNMPSPEAIKNLQRPPKGVEDVADTPAKQQ